VVHGPLQAVWLLDAARRHAPGRRPATFSFRAVRPLFHFDQVRLLGRAGEEVATELCTANGDGSRRHAGDRPLGRRVRVRLERSTLVVPGSNWSMIAKAAASDADAVCIDLEDAVAPDAKAASRANVARAFAELDFGRKTRAYRINALDTPFAYRDLIEVVEAAGDRWTSWSCQGRPPGRRPFRRDPARPDRAHQGLAVRSGSRR
jgi:hypothetical protein